MFKATSRQRTIFEIEGRLGESVKRRLSSSWADGFASKVLPVLLEAEEEFAILYCADNGRPNWSIARMVGLCILQEMHNMDDQTALDSLSFDVRWQHALGLEPEKAYLSRRSLVDFRSRLVCVDSEMKLLRSVFNKVGDAAIADLKISTKEQRIDSTIITSNISTFGRVDLFKKTLTNFLGWLSKEYPSLFVKLSSSMKKWYKNIEDNGWFGSIVKLDKKKKRELLSTLAGWLHEIDLRFGEHETISVSEPYLLVRRLLSEHCEIVKSADSDDDDTNSGNDGTGDDNPSSKIKVLGKVKSPSTSMQSPYDPDAGYSGHKGPGYFAHLTETCNNESTEIITDFFVVPAGDSDLKKGSVAIDNLAESNKQPDVLFADAGYPTAESLIEARKKGTQIIAPISHGNIAKDAVCRDQFQFDDTTGKCIACPEGHAPVRHGMRTSSSKPNKTLHAFFDAKECDHCPIREQCMTRPPNSRRPGSNRHIEIESHLIVKDRALAEQKNAEWWERYKIRAGIEATMSEMKRVNGLGKLRVRYITRVILAVGFKVSACNVKRWLGSAAKGNDEREQMSSNAIPSIFVLQVTSDRILCRSNGNSMKMLVFTMTAIELF